MDNQTFGYFGAEDFAMSPRGRQRLVVVGMKVRKEIDGWQLWLKEGIHAKSNGQKTSPLCAGHL